MILNSAQRNDKDTSFSGAARGKSWAFPHTSAMTEKAANKENSQKELRGTSVFLWEAQIYHLKRESNNIQD